MMDPIEALLDSERQLESLRSQASRFERAGLEDLARELRKLVNFGERFVLLYTEVLKSYGLISPVPAEDAEAWL